MSQTRERPPARSRRQPSATLQRGTARSAPYTYMYRARPADRERVRFETDATIDGFVSGSPRVNPRAASARRNTVDAPAVAVERSARTTRRAIGLSPFARLRLVLAAVFILGLGLAGRLYTVQVQNSSFLSAKGDEFHIQTTVEKPKRGQIRDANGVLLATSVPIYRFYATPCGSTAPSNAKTVEAVAPLLPKVAYNDLLTAFDTAPCEGHAKNITNIFASGVDAETADKIMALNRPSVFRESYAQRQYPNGMLAAQVLGFANAQSEGAYGVEGQYDAELHGVEAKTQMVRDRVGNPIPGVEQQIAEVQDGKDINLTLDTMVQMIVEQEVKKGISDHKADNGMALVMDPRTGAILAAVNFPTFDPNTYATTDPALYRNPLFNDIYEPGSTFKILTAAMGIDSGAVTPDSWADLPGCVTKKGWPICNYNSAPHAHQTVTDTLIMSSNVGAMWIAEKMKPETYYDYLKKFGIGSQTGVDLAAEAEGLVSWPTRKGWDMLDMDMSSFGQNTAVSPLQLIAAVSSVANGGKYMKPYIVQSITKDGVLYSEHQPEVVRQTISPQAAKTTSEMLVSAVECGETRFAHVDGYRISGKTGTAQIVTNGRYEDGGAGHTRGSTIAWPTDDPRFIVLVRLDRTKDIQWGSNTAAPVVQAITKRLLTYYSMQPTPGVDGCKYKH